MGSLAAQTAAAAVGTVAFALLFGVPGRNYVLCGLIGGAGWALYGLLQQAGWCTPTGAAFFAAALVTVLSRLGSVWQRCPSTVFLIAGIFPLVPGAGIYWTAYYVVSNRLPEALDSGFAAVKTAVAIVLGIVIMFELPNRLFHPNLRGRGK